MASTPSLVTIGKSSHAEHRAPLPLIHLFFGIGAVVGFLATTWWGVHLWMALHGEITVQPHFAFYRQAHAFAQIYLFIGLFVSGFLIQTMAKLLRVSATESPLLSFVLPFHLLALLGGALLESPLALKVPISMSYGLLLIHLAKLQRDATSYHRVRIALPLGIGLATLGGGALLDMGIPTHAAAVLVAGLLPIIFATIQQFVVGFLDGHLPSPGAVRVLGGGYVALMGATALFLWYPHTAAFSIAAGVAMLGCALTVATSTAAHVWAHRVDPVAVAASCALFWLTIAAGTLAIGGTTHADSVVHLIGTGVAIPLILATSARILGFLGTQEIMRDRTLTYALGIWQIVPVGRARLFDLPPWCTWVVGLAALVVLVWWLSLVLRRIGVVVRRRVLSSKVAAPSPTRAST